MRNIKIIVQIDRINIFSDIWLKYYINFFKSDNFYFIFENKFINIDFFKKYLQKFGFDSDKVNLITLDDIPSDVSQRMVFLSSIINNLVLNFLDGNTVVIYPDIDELIYHDNLLELLQSFNSDFLVTNPIDVIQNLDSESEYKYGVNLFEQRGFCLNSTHPIFSWYRKNNIIKSFVNWQDSGRHIYHTPPTDGLYLIHLGKFDYNFLEKINKENLNMYQGQNVNQNGYIGSELNEWYLSQHKSLSTIPEDLINKLKKFNL